MYTEFLSCFLKITPDVPSPIQSHAQTHKVMHKHTKGTKEVYRVRSYYEFLAQCNNHATCTYTNKCPKSHPHAWWIGGLVYLTSNNKQAHACTNTHAHIHTHPRTCMYTQACMHAWKACIEHTHTPTHARAHTRDRVYTQACTTGT